ncbi:MAG: hypothetical protein ACI9AU_001191 [Bacteroidia bacterium]|jgi:hypothetical protein
MKRIVIVGLMAICSLGSFAQISTISNNKPLGYINPAIQNYDLNKGIISASYILSPFTKEATPDAFLALGEFKISDNFRVGVLASQYENRLSKNTNFKAYASYRLELEKGNYLVFGFDVGQYTDEAKLAEFNKVFVPNKFYYADSSLVGRSTGIELGFAMGYQYNGFSAGIAFSKLNRPAVHPFPLEVFDTMLVRKDTAVILEESSFGIETNINIVYEWPVSQKVSLTHSLHIGNLGLGGFDYIGFQNIANINKKHSLGAGVFFNGSIGYMATAGFGFSENIKVEATSFFVEDSNFNETSRLYESNGLKPTIEVNLKYQF